MPPMASSSSADMSIFIHANTHVRPVPATAGLQVTQGWWNDSHAAEIAQARDTLPKHSMRTQWNLDQVFKYQWLLDELTQGNPLRNGPLAIVDADTVFQCNGTELRRRFDRIKSPLVRATHGSVSACRAANVTICKRCDTFATPSLHLR